MSAERKPTAADRPQFRRDVAKMLGDLNVGVTEISPDVTILCTRAGDFDPADNVLWEDEANKSAVRSDVQCFGCKSTMAMSNHAYERYSAFDKKPRVVCIQCAAEHMT